MAGNDSGDDTDKGAFIALERQRADSIAIAEEALAALLTLIDGVELTLSDGSIATFEATAAPQLSEFDGMPEAYIDLKLPYEHLDHIEICLNQSGFGGLSRDEEDELDDDELDEDDED